MDIERLDNIEARIGNIEIAFTLAMVQLDRIAEGKEKVRLGSIMEGFLRTCEKLGHSVISTLDQMEAADENKFDEGVDTGSGSG